MLDAALASAFARVALTNVTREYPRRLDQLITGADTEWRPRVLHPAFYGSYDWHSAVHMHWLLVRLLRWHPDLQAAPEIERVLSAHFAPDNVRAELAFLRSAGGTTFERPYGWAWLLELHAELLRLGRWAEALAPLATHLAARMRDYVAGLPYPVRAGTHGNTAFAGILALDYAETMGEATLKQALTGAAQRWYGDDRDCPVRYEPSADDFLSPALVEALFMQRVLPAEEFERWWQRFRPADWGPLGRPPTVNDHADAKQSHLDGLCLSRAWCFAHLGFRELAEVHLAAGLPHVVGGDYAGEHWLASFAVLALSAAARKTP